VLKSKIVEVEGVGTIEFREPLWSDVQGLLKPDNTNLGSELLVLCTYQNGKKLFDGEVGVSAYMKLLSHVGDCLEVCGMGEEKKD
jgi:hypothetical protein